MTREKFLAVMERVNLNVNHGFDPLLHTAAEVSPHEPFGPLLLYHNARKIRELLEYDPPLTEDQQRHLTLVLTLSPRDEGEEEYDH